MLAFDPMHSYQVRQFAHDMVTDVLDRPVVAITSIIPHQAEWNAKGVAIAMGVHHEQSADGRAGTSPSERDMLGSRTCCP